MHAIEKLNCEPVLVDNDNSNSMGDWIDNNIENDRPHASQKIKAENKTKRNFESARAAGRRAES